MLSKSNFIRGRQCPLALWYQKKRYTPDFGILKNKQPIFQQGKYVESLAHQCFKEDCFIHLEPSKNLIIGAQQTKQHIQEGYTVLFEASAVDEKHQVSARIDVLRKVENGWELIEIKSSIRPKMYQIEDIAFQCFVFKKAGYNITKCTLMLPDPTYVRGEELDPIALFQRLDVTQKIHDKQPQIHEQICALSVFQNCSHPPEITTGSHCKKPFVCEYQNWCKNPQQFSIFNETFNATLTNSQPLSTNSFQHDAVKNFLNGVQFPLFFLDYEVIMPVIPAYKDTQPFESIPFQFSLHRVLENGCMDHKDFLHTQKTDPRLPFIDGLLKHCGEKGSIVVFNQQFERSQNEKLAKKFPHYKNSLLALNKRMIDLMEPFKKKWVQFEKQQNSFSIKKILQALFDSGYEKLAIQNGQDAMSIYLNYVVHENNLDSKTCEALKKYCGLDTYAMILILNKLFQMADYNETRLVSSLSSYLMED